MPYPRNATQARSKKIKRGTWRGTLIHILEKRLSEREREDRSKGARPPNLLNIALYGLASLPFLLVPKRSHSCSKYPHPMRVHARTEETSQQISKETKQKHAKRQARKRYQIGANKL